MMSRGLFCDFDDISGKNAPSGLYCHSLAQLYEVCIKEESILHPVTYLDACMRLIRNVNKTLADLDVKGYPVVEFKFGRSFTTAKTKCKLRPDKPVTWNQDKGIASEWREILKEGYNGVTVLACINKELVPNYIQDVIKVKSSNGTRQKNQHGIDHRFYAQGLLNALIQHYTFSEPDCRIRNSSFDSVKKDNDSALPEILYMAFKVEKRPELLKETPVPENQVQSNEQQSDVAKVSAVTTDTGSECIYRVIYPEQETRKLVKIPKSEIGNIKSKLSAAFNLPRDLSLTYTLYMSEDDEWYECEEEDLPQRGKLKIAVIDEEPKITFSSANKSSTVEHQGKKIQSVQPFKQKKASAVVKKAKKNITQKKSVVNARKVIAQKHSGVLSKSKKTSSLKSISLHKSTTRISSKSASPSVLQKTSRLSVSPIKSSPKVVETVDKDSHYSRKRSAQFPASSSPTVKRLKKGVLSPNSSEARTRPVSARSLKKECQQCLSDDSDDRDDQMLVKDLEPGQHQKKLVVEVGTMDKSLVNKFRQLDCVFNMHFEDSTGDIFGYVQPADLYNSLESGQTYEISNFEVWKSPDNVYGLSLDQRAVIKKVTKPAAKSSVTDSPKDTSRQQKQTKSKDSRHSVSEIEWTEALDRRLMDIHKEMKREFGSNNWIFVSERLGTGHTNEQCRIRVGKIQNAIKRKKSLSYQKPARPVEKEEPEEHEEEDIHGSSEGGDIGNVSWTDSKGRVHNCVLIPKSDTPCQRKKCVYCLMIRRKTACGGAIETKKKCQQCNQPLCMSSKKDCFYRYHTKVSTADNMYQESDSPDVDKGGTSGRKSSENNTRENKQFKSTNLFGGVGSLKSGDQKSESRDESRIGNGQNSENEMSSEMTRNEVTSDITRNEITEMKRSETKSEMIRNEMTSDITRNEMRSETRNEMICETTINEMTSEMTRNEMISERTRNEMRSETARNEVISETARNDMVSEKTRNEISSELLKSPVSSGQSGHETGFERRSENLNEVARHESGSKIRETNFEITRNEICSEVMNDGSPEISTKEVGSREERNEIGSEVHNEINKEITRDGIFSSKEGPRSNEKDQCDMRKSNNEDGNKMNAEIENPSVDHMQTDSDVFTRNFVGKPPGNGSNPLTSTVRDNGRNILDFGRVSDSAKGTVEHDINHYGNESTRIGNTQNIHTKFDDSQTIIYSDQSQEILVTDATVENI